MSFFNYKVKLKPLVNIKILFPQFSYLKKGDYIYLYQQQREQLQRRYQEKDDYIKQLTQDRFNLQVKLKFFFSKKKKNYFFYLEKNIRIRNAICSEFKCKPIRIINRSNSTGIEG
jgi:hypothetical protein